MIIIPSDFNRFESSLDCAIRSFEISDRVFTLFSPKHVDLFELKQQKLSKNGSIGKESLICGFRIDYRFGIFPNTKDPSSVWQFIEYVRDKDNTDRLQKLPKLFCFLLDFLVTFYPQVKNADSYGLKSVDPSQLESSWITFFTDRYDSQIIQDLRMIDSEDSRKIAKILDTVKPASDPDPVKPVKPAKSAKEPIVTDDRSIADRLTALPKGALLSLAKDLDFVIPSKPSKVDLENLILECLPKSKPTVKNCKALGKALGIPYTSKQKFLDTLLALFFTKETIASPVEETIASPVEETIDSDLSLAIASV